MYIIGVKNFVVEVDAKYIKGMINNPDIQPSATIKSPDDPDDESDTEEWIDNAYAFSMECLNDLENIKIPNIPRTPEDSKTLDTDKISPELSTPVQNNLYSENSFQTRFTQTISVLTNSDLKIPRNEKAIIRDEKLKMIKEFLRDPVRMTKGSITDQKKFIKSVSEYFVFEKKLWRKDRQGRHKLVIWEDKQLDLIRQAHDELGHKGVFTVRLRLGERFWWPHMDEDVKWFVQTCHECQIRLVKKIHIPPTVPTPAGLFSSTYHCPLHSCRNDRNPLESTGLYPK
jgi:Integrase zinc binding domain